MMNLLYIYFTTLLLTYGCVAEEVCETGPIDLVFVLDDSGSVGINNFQLCLQAAVDFTAALDIGLGIQKSRVGLVVFNSDARLGFRLDDYYTNEEVATAILNYTDYEGASTNIAAGMNFALTEVFDYHRNKTGYRPVPRIMLLMTDGQDESDVTSQHNIAAAEGIITFALGVGSGVNMRELTAATGDQRNVYLAADYSALKGIINQVCHEVASSVAPPTPSLLPASCGCEDEKLVYGVNYWLDIIFVLDSSNGISDLDFKGVKSLISSFGNLQIGPGNNGTKQYTRVAIVNTADKAEVIANLTTFKDGADLKQQVKQKLNKKGGRVFNVQAGLQAAQDMVEQEEQAQRRLNVRKVIILFSTSAIDCRENRNGLMKDTDVLCSLISIMEGEKISLIAVAIKMAGSTEYPFIDVVDKCNGLINDNNMMMNLLRALCRANCYCLTPYTQFKVQEKCESYGECVFVHELPLSYMSAEDTCHDEDSFVATVLSKDKDNFLRELHLDAGFYPYWVGMRRQGGTFIWDDGHKQGSRDFANWCSTKQQPDFSKGDCVYEAQCKGFDLGWFSAAYGAMVPTNFYSCQTSACSVEHYCEFSRMPTKIKSK